MSEPLAIAERRVHIETTDGVTLVGDLASPSSPRAAAVLLHPHPQYGGDRHNPVIAALHAALPSAGIASFRFDFRSGFTGGDGERLDAVAVIDRVLAEFPGVPVAAIGYSFGAWVALGLHDTRVHAVAAIAPPLAVMSAVPTPVVPTFVITPAHDQFSPPAENLPVVERWRADGGPEIEHMVVEMADHFLAGSIVSLATQVTAWITARR